MNLTRDILRNRHRLSERQIDDFLEEQSHNENSLNRMMGMQQIGFFLRIAKFLQNHNIDFINLKGPLLSQRIYEDPTYRYSRDFDILIQPYQVDKTIELLRAEGFEYPNNEWYRLKKKQDIILHFTNQIEMLHEESGVMIEIHWKLFSTRITDHKNIDKFIQEETVTIEFGGVKLKRLSTEFELFYLIIHGGVHAWFRLKWLVDIHEMLNRKTFNWNQFHHIITSCNSQKLVSICNHMLLQFFPDDPQIPIAARVPPQLSKIALEQCRQPEGDPHISRFNTLKLLFYRINLFPSFRYKLDILKVITFCKTDLKYSWLPPYRLVYLLFRPIGYLLRKVRILN